MRKTLLVLAFALALSPVNADGFLNKTKSSSTNFTLKFGQSYNLSSYSFSYLAALAEKTALLKSRQAGVRRITTRTPGGTTSSSNAGGFNPTMIQPVGDPTGN